MKVTTQHALNMIAENIRRAINQKKKEIKTTLRKEQFNEYMIGTIRIDTTTLLIEGFKSETGKITFELTYP